MRDRQSLRTPAAPYRRTDLTENHHQRLDLLKAALAERSHWISCPTRISRTQIVERVQSGRSELRSDKVAYAKYRPRLCWH